MNNISHKLKFFNSLLIPCKALFLGMLFSFVFGPFFTACAPGGGQNNLLLVNDSVIQDPKNSQKTSKLLAAWQETAPGKKQWGFIDQSGHFVIPPVYEGACTGINSRLLTVKQNGYWGAITNEQKVALDFVYSYPLLFSNGLAPVKKNGRWGFINIRGKLVIQPVYEQVKLFVKDDTQLLARVKDKGAWGLIDTTGKYVLAPGYELVTDCYAGLIGMKVDDKYGFINKKGEQVIKPVFKNIKRFSHHLAPVQIEDGHWGYINTNGELNIKPVYGDADYAEDANYYPVRHAKFWGYIDKGGHNKLPSMYDDAGPFYNGYARVVKKGVEGYINKQNKVIWDAASALYFMDEQTIEPQLRTRLVAALEKQMDLPGDVIKRIIKARPWDLTDEMVVNDVEFLANFSEYEFAASLFNSALGITTASGAKLNTEPAKQQETFSSKTDWKLLNTWYGVVMIQAASQSKEELQWFWVDLY